MSSCLPQDLDVCSATKRLKLEADPDTFEATSLRLDEGWLRVSTVWYTASCEPGPKTECEITKLMELARWPAPAILRDLARLAPVRLTVQAAALLLRLNGGAPLPGHVALVDLCAGEPETQRAYLAQAAGFTTVDLVSGAYCLAARAPGPALADASASATPVGNPRPLDWWSLPINTRAIGCLCEATPPRPVGRRLFALVVLVLGRVGLPRDMARLVAAEATGLSAHPAAASRQN